MCEYVLIWFKHEYRRLTLSSRCDVIRDVINMKLFFLDNLPTFFPYLMANLSYVKYFKDLKFRACGELFDKSVTGSLICYVIR